MDDIPVGLFATEAEAERCAQTMSFKRGYAICRALGIDCSTPVCFCYVPFKDGVAQDIHFVNREDDA